MRDCASRGIWGIVLGWVVVVAARERASKASDAAKSLRRCAFEAFEVTSFLSLSLSLDERKMLRHRTRAHLAVLYMQRSPQRPAGSKLRAGGVGGARRPAPGAAPRLKGKESESICSIRVDEGDVSPNFRAQFTPRRRLVPLLFFYSGYKSPCLFPLNTTNPNKTKAKERGEKHGFLSEALQNSPFFQEPSPFDALFF